MRPVFIASIGNPGAEYAHTLHSAGHTLLAALVDRAGLAPLSLNVGKTGSRGRCSFSDSQGIAFWESPTYMNDGGPTLHSAWKRWCKSAAIANFDAISALESGQDAPTESLLPRLIVLHDELEQPIGKFSVKTSVGQSARGHNGLKSLLAAPAMNSVRFTRVGIGIGPRPVSREPEVVAKYVLHKMTQVQRSRVEGLAIQVWKEIEDIRAGKDEMGGGKKKQLKQERKGLIQRRLSLAASDEGRDVESTKSTVLHLPSSVHQQPISTG